MTKRKRDYKAEYARRIAKGKERGLSLSQARGHPKATEKAVAPKKRKPIPEDKLQVALSALAKGDSLSQSARTARLTPEKLRNYVSYNKIAKRKGRRWVLGKKLKREMRIFSDGRERTVVLPDFKSASVVGGYLAAVRKLLDTNNRAVLKPFIGEFVTDIHGDAHLFETDPNILYRLNLSGTESFEQIYRIII